MGTVSAFGSECNPGRSTYGGDTGSGTVRAFGSEDGPGQWTHGGDITVRTVRAFSSECSPEQSTKRGDPSSKLVKVFGSGYGPRRRTHEGGWWTEIWSGPKSHIVGYMPHATRNDDLVLGTLVAENVGRVAMSPMVDGSVPVMRTPMEIL